MTVRVKRVLGDRVLVKKVTPPKKIGNIALPDETINKERLTTAVGTVVEVGSLCWKNAEMRDVQHKQADGSLVTERAGAPWCAVGDRVLYQQYAGMRLPDPTAQDRYHPDLVFVLDRDLIAVLEPEALSDE